MPGKKTHCCEWCWELYLAYPSKKSRYCSRDCAHDARSAQASWERIANNVLAGPFNVKLSDLPDIPHDGIVVADHRSTLFIQDCQGHWYKATLTKSDSPERPHIFKRAPYPYDGELPVCELQTAKNEYVGAQLI